MRIHSFKSHVTDRGTAQGPQRWDNWGVSWVSETQRLEPTDTKWFWGWNMIWDWFFKIFNSLPAFASKKDAYHFPEKRKSWRNDVSSGSMSHFKVRLQVLEAESAVKVMHIGHLGEIWNRSTLREKQDLLTSKKIAKLSSPRNQPKSAKLNPKVTAKNPGPNNSLITRM